MSEPRRGRGLKIAAAAVLLGAAGAGAWWLSRSPVFGLERIEVAGNAIVSRDQVVEAAGIRLGESALALDLGAVEARVESLEAIEDATVERVGSLGIRITVVETAPAVVVRVGEERWYLDRRGNPVGRPISTVGSLPVIETAWTRPGPPPLAPTAVAEVLRFWDAAPDRVRDRIAAFERADGPSVVFRYRGVRVVFGSADDTDAKLEALSLVLRRARREGSTVLQVDVRSPSHPAARLR